MAEGGLPPDLDLHLLECPICLERLQQPKSLPCLHSFCQDCLWIYITKELSGKMASATSFPCPVCRRTTSPVNQTETKDKWAKQFPTNNVAHDIIQLGERSSEPIYCKPCQTKGNKTSPAQFWCKTMNISLCESCKVQLHDILHNDCDILDITVYVNTHCKHDKSVPRCDRHDEKMIWYCEDHQLLCCPESVIEDHRGCEEVTKTTEYFKKLKSGEQLKEMQAALKKGAEVMDSVVKDFDQQLQAMLQNQEIALQIISDLRRKVDKRLDKLQKDITDDLITLFKKEKRDMEASSQQCERLMNGMKNTLKSSIRAVEGNNDTETIVLYQRGQAEVESCKSLVRDMRKSFTSVSIEHHIASGNDIISDDAMGKIVVRKQPRCIPEGHIEFANPMSERRVKEIGKFSIKSPSDRKNCYAVGVVYLPCAHIVVSDYNNKKLKLFTDKGQYLDELAVQGYPRDMCLMTNNTVAVAVGGPGGIRVVKVKASKLFLASEINMSNRKYCYGITHTDGKFVIGTSGGEVYSITQNGAAVLLYTHNSTCWSLTHDRMTRNTFVSVSNTNPGSVVVSRLSADKPHRSVMSVGVVMGARGIDVDKEGNIYVCGMDSHNIVQMSRDGAHVRELLTTSEGVHNPCSLAVRGDTFVVTSTSNTDEDNYIAVFALV
ncbi:transcription intermediary factor 1-beta-like [Mizuhopecten yessoensis]|uniref:transcription intermediary factor 1-beta-like n=1 Tax=Mizuhopecten yessoensis TaxID=6573 RepID=UPI000B45BDCE|nr:transcription intermediary factor 1-beta-like [Mizuhopecten yessoensis]